MSSERLPGVAGGIQFASQTELVPTVDIVAEQQIQAGNERTTLFDKLRNKLTSIAVIGALAVGLVINPIVGEGAAQAANTETAVVGMPFEGNWSTYVHPSSHSRGSADWGTDIYAPPDTEARLRIGNISGDATYTTSNVAETSCGAGKRVRVNIKVRNIDVGWVQYEHLDTSLGDNTTLQPGDVLGKTKNWGNLPCYAVTNDKGVHLHVGMKNIQDNHSCYVDNGERGVLLGDGANLGVLGSPNGDVKEACTEIPDPGGGGQNPPAPDPLNLSFVRLNDARGNAWVDSYSESSGFRQLVENTDSGYPRVPGDGSIVPIFQPDGDLSFVNLNHPSGHAQVVTYSEASGYRNAIEIAQTSYPAVPGDGAVIPMYQFDGDLSFIRLNDPRGVEVVAYSQASGYRTLTEQNNSASPPVETNGSVVPAYWLNDDLVLLRFNHYSGKTELVSYSKSSGYRQLANYALLSYPALSAPGVPPPDKAVTPMFHPQNGNLSFVRLNHYSGKVELLTYSVGSNFQQAVVNGQVEYPAVPGDGNVIPRYSN